MGVFFTPIVSEPLVVHHLIWTKKRSLKLFYFSFKCYFVQTITTHNVSEIQDFLRFVFLVQRPNCATLLHL